MSKSVLLALILLFSSQSLVWAQTEPVLEGFSEEYRTLQADYAQKSLIRRFYQAFQRHDGPAMVACYHPEAEFQDPVFGTLAAREAKAMWLMLLDVSEGQLKIDFSDLDVKNGLGQAYWQAWYQFSATGNPVHNQIQAQFTFKDGLIYRHRDQFDLHHWSAMALGPVGALLGGTDFMQNTVRKLAKERLLEYLKAHPEL